MNNLPPLSPILGSTNIAAAGYDPNTLTMYVQFRSGDTYAYYGIARGAFDSLQGAVKKSSTLRSITAAARYEKL